MVFWPMLVVLSFVVGLAVAAAGIASIRAQAKSGGRVAPDKVTFTLVFVIWLLISVYARLTNNNFSIRPGWVFCGVLVTRVSTGVFMAIFDSRWKAA